MKRIEELTLDECQTFLDQMFDNSVEFNRIIFENDCIDGCGLEYKVKSHDQLGFVSFSNPDFISWLYDNDIDISFSLKQLKFDYNELDETNSILFEYAMKINGVVEKYKPDFFNQDHNIGEYMIKSAALDEIKLIQKDLISKL